MILAMKRIWRGFWQVADPKIWVASTVPMVLGGTLAYAHTGRFDWYWFVIGVIGVYCIEIGKNAANDLVDYLTGVDLMVPPDNVTPFSGGKKSIVDGNLTVKEAAIITALMLAAGGAIGLYIAFTHEMRLLYIGCAGLFLAAAYSLPPFKLSYRGLGEFAVGLAFGPLIVMGTYLVQTHSFSAETLLASLPIGFLIANVLWINQYPDYEADSAGKKMNWLVRIGKERGLGVYKTLFAAAYASLLVLSVYSRNPYWLLPFAGIPLVRKAVRTASENYENIQKMIPANLNTVKVYQLTGIAMAVAAVLTRINN